MIDGKFVKALSSRHLLRRKSRIMPFRNMDTRLVRRRRDLDLVYRIHFGGIFIWKWSGFKESTRKSSMRDATLFRLAPAIAPVFSERRIKYDAPDKRDLGMGLKGSYRGKDLQNWHMSLFLPKLYQSNSPPHSKFLSHSKSHSGETADRISSTWRGKASRLLPDWRSDRGYSLLKTAFRSSFRAASFLSGTEENPGRGTKEQSGFNLTHFSSRNPNIPVERAFGLLPDWRFDQGDSLLKTAFRPSFRASFLPGTEENHERVPKKQSGFDLTHFSDRNANPVEPALISSSPISVSYRTGGRAFGLTRRWSDGTAFRSPDQSPPQLKPAPYSSSQFIQLVGTSGIKTTGIVRRSGTGATLNSNHVHRRALPASSLSPHATVSSQPDEGLPAMIKKKPEINRYFDTPGMGNGMQAQMAWAKSGTSERQSSAEIRHASNLPHSLEKEEISDETGRKSSFKPQAININKLSEKVYSIIERKLRIERERRGIYA